MTREEILRQFRAGEIGPERALELLLEFWGSTVKRDGTRFTQEQIEAFANTDIQGDVEATPLATPEAT
ncbi:hypothetical protein LCGC14_3129570, partial [marine sediment metagenome]